MAYVCEKSVGPNKSCDFRSGKVILQQEIAAEQMRKLLAEGRTDILRGFVSNKTRRKFSAFLVKKPDGGVGFEFEPRPAKAAKSPPAAKAAKVVATPAADGEETAATPRKTGTKAVKPIAKTAAVPAKSAAKAATKTAAKRATPAATKTSRAPVRAASKATTKTAAKSTRSAR
jgi:DNA topoisomerase III